MVYNIKEILEITTNAFKKKNITNPRLDAEILLGEILSLSRIELYTHFDQPLTAGETDRYREFVRRRMKREPVAYILGKREFFGREFAVSPAVLVPRPDTETLVETVVASLKGRDPIGAVIDLGTGSGAIAVTLSLELDCEAVAADISDAALKIAAANAEKLKAGKVICKRGDLFSAVAEDEDGAPKKFAAVVSNPPYIPAAAIKTLEPEIKYEPEAALNGGEDGLAFYRRIVADSRRHLASGGLLAVEIGIGQADAVVDMIKQANRPAPFYDEATIKITADLSGIPRAVSVKSL